MSKKSQSPEIPTPEVMFKPLVDIETMLFDTFVAKPAETLGLAPPPKIAGPATVLAAILAGKPEEIVPKPPGGSEEKKRAERKTKGWGL